MGIFGKKNKKEDLYYIVFDLETSGFSEEKNAILEIALMIHDAETHHLMEAYSVLVVPHENKKIDEKALRVNGIDMDLVHERHLP